MSLNIFDRDRLTPARIAAIYLLFGLLALVAFDWVLPRVLAEPLVGQLQALKGLLEVLVSAGLIFVLVRASVRDLEVRQRAIDAAPIGITMTDPTREDNPLVFVNDEFEDLTGYDEATILGRNCRFLQGPETDEATLSDLREAVEADQPASVDVVNYRENGAKFWNKLDVAPVRDEDGSLTHFVGFQSDITERKIREERLRVLNRVLRHNFRNKLTVIGGHVEILRRELDEQRDSLAVIQTAIEDLQSLTETVRKSEGVLEAATDSEGPIALDEQLRLLVHSFRDRYPDATIDLTLPEGSVRIDGSGLVRAIEEAIDNAIRHNDSQDPTVSVTVDLDEDGWLSVQIEDDGPGIPPAELEVLTEGETPLKHADRLGIWSMHWIVNLAGGTMCAEAGDLGGTRLSMSVPSASA